MTTATQQIPTPVPVEPEPAATEWLRMVPLPCCVCGISDGHPVALGEDFEYDTVDDEFVVIECRGCGLVYLDPRPADEELERIYPAEYHAFGFEGDSSGLVRRIRCWLEARRLSKTLGDLPEDARILDVGCGDGFHLKLLRDHGPDSWSLEGLDVDSRAVCAAEQADLHVHRARVEDNTLTDTHYDAILLIMTIEHVANPVETMAAIRRLLKPGGRLIVVTDNTRTIPRRVFGGRTWGGYHFPRHFNLFHRDNLAAAAELAGLHTESIRTEVNPVNWVYSIHNLLVDLNAPGWLRRRFTLRSPVSLACFTIADSILNLLGRGSNLRATFTKPSG